MTCSTRVLLVLGALTSCVTPGAGPPSGATLRLTPITGAELSERLAHPPGRATILNVWASWCAPCAREFPMLLAERRLLAPRGVDTILLSVDEPADRAAVEAFALRQGLDTEVFVRAGDDAELIKALGPSWSGGLPATMIFGPSGELRFFHEGELEENELIRAVELVLE